MINTYNERDLHSELKTLLSRSGDLIEIPYKGFIIDIKREDLLIEIQTKSLNSLRKKLETLLDINRIRIVHPILKAKEIIVVSQENEILRKRMSPVHGDITDIFDELIYIPDLFKHMNLEILLLIVSVQEIRKDDGKGSWRRRGISLINTKLTQIHEEHLIKDAVQLFKYLPKSIINSEFSTRILSLEMNITLKKSQKICYALKKMGLIKPVSKEGQLIIYKTI